MNSECRVYNAEHLLPSKEDLEAINLAMNNEKELVGIIVNAFTEPYVLDKEIWGIVEKIESRIQ